MKDEIEAKLAKVYPPRRASSAQLRLVKLQTHLCVHNH
jgi:hypothetical protein